MADTEADMNASPLFSVDHEFELNALFRVLVEAKFRPSIPDTDIPSSKFVIAMIERVFEAQMEVALANGDQLRVSSLAKWQAAEENPVLVADARSRLRECPLLVWERWSKEQRLAHIRNVLSPLRAKDALLEELLGEMP
ncbi:MAG: hypothetical protein V4625_18710 [Pseudomonadota bacterium]